MLLVYLYRVLWFIGLVLLQALVLNHIHICGIATPFLYIYMILKFPSGMSRNEAMLWAFFLGLVVDIFSNTHGMNTFASVAVAMVRPYMLQLFTPRDMPDSIIPSFKTMGPSSFMKYLTLSILIHCFLLVAIEVFSFSSILLTLLRVVACTLLTVACAVALDGIRRKEK
jgi:rod shape-determining protein MreD